MKTIIALCFLAVPGFASQIIPAPPGDGDFTASFGQLYEDTASPDALTIPDDTASKWQNSTVGETSGGGLVVGSAATDTLTIGVNGGGTYAITFLVSCEWGASVDASFSIYVNGGEEVEIKSTRGFAANSPGTTGSTGLLVLENADIIDLRIFQSSGSSKNVLLFNVSITIHRVSG